MQKSSSKQSAKVLAEQPPYLSTNEIGINDIKNAVPKGYRLATLSEAKLCYNKDQQFKEYAEKAGSMWVMGEDRSIVCARAYCGLFRADNPAGKDYRPVTDTAHAAYVRDEGVRISRRDEMKESFKNLLRRDMLSILY
jgi:hypothetical protein